MKFYLLEPLNEGFNVSAEGLLGFAVIESARFVKLGLFVEPLDNKLFREYILVAHQQLHECGCELGLFGVSRLEE